MSEASTAEDPGRLSVKAEVRVGPRRYEVDLGRSVDLATPIVFDGQGPEAFHLPRPTQVPVRAGEWVGSTREGGSVNCRLLTLAPHGNGTHTESVAHLVDDEVAVADVCPSGLVPAALLTVAPFALGESGEAYPDPGQPDDAVLTAQALEVAARAVPEGFWEAAILRVPGARPEGGAFSGTNPPYLTLDAMSWLLARGVSHLLVEVPSVDREDDGGRTASHRRFWNLDEGARSLDARTAWRRTITEMVQVPGELDDGPFLLNLQVPPLFTDAAPSRPRLFAVRAL